MVFNSIGFALIKIRHRIYVLEHQVISTILGV